MPRRPLLPLLACLAVSACDKGEGSSDTPPPRTGEDVPIQIVGSAPAVPKLKGPIALPQVVPLEASAVLAMRVPESLFDSVIAADPMGLATEGMQDLRTDLDTFLQRTIGMKILDAKAVAAFLVGKQDFAVVLVGVEGDINGKKTGAHEGVDLFEGQDDLVLARTDDVLLMGTKAGVEAAIDAGKDSAKSAGGGDLGKMFAAHTEGSAFAIAVDIGRAPDALTREIPPNVRFERALVSFGADGLQLRAEGDEAKLQALAGVITSGMKVAADAAEEQRKRALEREDDVMEGAATIIAAHYARSAQKLLEPEVADGALTIGVPMKAGDPAILAAVAGIGAAIAIPAFTKYMRRSKTSEARVQIAKMFDAASAYFNEEHVARGEAVDPLAGLDVAHVCPNDGNAKGQSGITPPLSVDCNAGPAGRCVPMMGDEPAAPGYYPLSQWTDNPVWNALNFQQEQAHYFHYNFIWENGGSGYGNCQFTAQAFGDLDGDGIFSTYERSGAADEMGVNAAAGMYIDQEVE